jgi:hypothetical protein
VPTIGKMCHKMSDFKDVNLFYEFFRQRVDEKKNYDNNSSVISFP